MEGIRSTIAASAPWTFQGSKRTAFTSSRSADLMVSPYKRSKEDSSEESLSSCASLSARDVTLPPTNTTVQPRTLVGGKGLFLHLMQQANIPIPPFTVVDIPLVASLEQFPFPSACLLPFLPDIHKREGSYTLEQLQTSIAELPDQQQTQWLKGLSGFIVSEDCYQQLKNCPAAEKIRQCYLTLQQQSNGAACIIRSSGMYEDRFGDAQAGRYDSRVHGDGDILKTCLQVLSSAYRPGACRSGQVEPIALIMQECIHCQMGGVVISHSTLQDDTMQVEYAPGQPRGAVSGDSGIRPHRCTIRRNDGKASEPLYRFTPGDISQQFVLEKTASGEGYIEQSVMTDAKGFMLADETLQKLQRYTELLENMIRCPVDIEFGVDDEQQLFLFQVRPVTQLPGSTHYTAAAPSLPLAAGTMVSEGCCSGSAVMVDKPVNVAQIPQGAIVFAEHASDWMLAPDILQQVGAFVFRQGGTNDHVAITLRQAGIPCLLAGSQYSAALTAASAEPITLVAGSFAGNPGAYLLKGDQSAHWQSSSTSSDTNITSSTAPSEPADFTLVDEGFAWLNHQNDRLLNYFHADRLLSRYLGLGRSKALSMSAERADLLQQLAQEICLLQQDLQLFIVGYQRFLDLATTSQSDTISSAVEPFIKELPLLKEQWKSLKSSIDDLCKKVVMPLNTDQELPARPTNFRQWLDDCQTLQDQLQKLTQPEQVGQIHSAHDLIYWLHRRFVNALAPVAESSGQGQMTRITENKQLINILPQGVCGLLNDDCISVLNKLKIRDEPGKVSLSMLNMVDAAFINVILGIHVCDITMLEQAEGGKGRTLRLNISDNFSQDNYNGNLQGKFKRFWFLVQTLRSASIDENTRQMALSFNENAGKMTIECAQINSTVALQRALVKLVTILSGLTSLDMSINEFNCGNNIDKWCFKTLINKCQKGLEEPMDQWIFTHCLVLDAIVGRGVVSNRGRLEVVKGDYTFLDYLDSKYKLIMEISRKAYCPYCDTPVLHRIKELREIFTDATKHLEPDDAARIIKEVLIHLAVESKQPYFIRLLNEDFDLEHDRDLAVFLIHQNPEMFIYAPDRFKDDTEIVKLVMEKRIDLFQYVSNRLKKDKSLVMLAVSNTGYALRYASDDLKNDKSLVMFAVSHYGYALGSASTDLQNDPEVVLLAAKNDYSVLRNVGSTIKNNEALLRIIIEETPKAIKYATDSLKNDKDFVLSLLSRDARIYKYIGDRLKSDPDIQASAGIKDV